MKFKGRFLRQRKRILLAGTSEVTLDGLVRVNEIIAGCTDHEAYLTTPRQTRPYARRCLTRVKTPVRFMGIVRALCFPWDLIVFSDHYNGAWFHPDIPKVYVSHGIDNGNTFGTGSNYTYGRNTLDDRGQVIYDVMFVDNRYNRDLILSYNPALENRLAVVGNLMADELQALNENRGEIRRNMGLLPEDRVLLLLSTWNSESLIQQFGLDVLRELPGLSKSFTIFMLLHPLNDHAVFSDQPVIRELIRRYRQDGVARRVDPDDSILPYLVAADMVLTDHTSAFLYYALLEKPFLFIPLNRARLIKNALTWKFYELQKAYDLQRPLCEQLEHAIRHFPRGQVQQLSHLTSDERGNAKRRVREQIVRFL